MLIKKIILLLFISFLVKNSTGQMCTTLGQNPSTAFPVCGTSSFSQSSVPICGNRTVPCPCPGSLFTDKNPFWYKFTCFTAGTLGFTITPNNTNTEDYDWQLFDVTGHNPDDVYTDPSLFVACDWSGDFGITGAGPSGPGLVECDGPGVPLFSAMPTLVQGHDYLLLISHFSDTQAGYSLLFGGGTASITDPTDPHLQNAKASCDGTLITVKLNKRMKCASLSTDGSEFTISTALSNIISASGFGCAVGFDMDSVSLTLNNPLPPGNYTLTIKNGTDGNTLKDNCDRLIPAGESIPLIVFPIIPTPMDSLSPVKCAPDVLQLVFRKNIRCSSIAPDGSDFIVTGTTPVTVIGATGNCSNNLTTIISVQLNAPIQTQGNYQIRLVTGSDGNTIIDDCGQETPAGATINFSTKDTVNADFTYSNRLGCKRDTIDYIHDGRNGVNRWQWSFDGLRSSNLQNPVIVYGTFGQKQTQLIVSNGVCSDTSSVTIVLDSAVKASFEITSLVCPGDLAIAIDHSSGKINSWLWDFGNGKTSISQSPPPQSYPVSATSKDIPVKLVVMNRSGCIDSTIQKVRVINNCFIAVPGAFTPNNDGLNDFLYPLNAYKAVDLRFSVYNRFGQLMFTTSDWTNKWDGSFKGQPAEPGSYVWLLKYTDKDTGKKVLQKGSSILIR